MISTKEIVSAHRLTHWAQIIRERSESGLSVKAYCKQIGISGNTYFYWQKRLREATCEKLTPNPTGSKGTTLPAVSFTEVVVAELVRQPETTTEAALPSDIHIKIGGVQITTDSTYFQPRSVRSSAVCVLQQEP